MYDISVFNTEKDGVVPENTREALSKEPQFYVA